MGSNFDRGSNFNKRVNLQHVRGSLINDPAKRSLYNVEK